MHSSRDTRACLLHAAAASPWPWQAPVLLRAEPDSVPAGLSGMLALQTSSELAQNTKGFAICLAEGRKAP